MEDTLNPPNTVAIALPAAVAPAKRLRYTSGTPETEATRRQVAALTTMGLSNKAIAKELRIDDDTVASILAMASTKEWIEDIGNDAIRAAKARLRARIASLADNIVATLDYQLTKKKSVQAAALALKVMGMDQQVDASAGGNITVYLPGAQAQPTPATITLDQSGKQVKAGKAKKVTGCGPQS